MGARSLPSGLYAITDNQLIPPGELTRRVTLAIAGGAAVIQYRDKRAVPSADPDEVASLAVLCRQHGIPLIINDDVPLAAAVGAAGVHLGEHDTGLQAARRQLGPGALIGVSCYNRLELACEAEDGGADYVAFGRFFPSSTKPAAVQATPALLTEARRRLELPIVAIGGITPENGAELVSAGADLLAVIHGVFAQPDVEAAARRYAALFD
jgi:thiamine-phosphate pyrophosphorylase